MSENLISKAVKDFVFHSIDSAEQLDILLLLHSDVRKALTATEISSLLRSTPTSIEKRIEKMTADNLVVQFDTDGEIRYGFHHQNEAALQIVNQLADLYRSHRYGILDIIFSPLKKSRDFAEAFKISNSKDPKGGRNG